MVLAAAVYLPGPLRAQGDGPEAPTHRFEDEVPPGEASHFFLPFEVPEGIAEIEVRHDDLSDANVLDWGLDDPAGHRGWGGGLRDPAIVGIEAASRGYVPGPIPAGTWRVVVGKARIDDPPGRYRVEVFLRQEATLTPQTERRPYTPVAALETGRRWYPGDFHVHSRESGDARDDTATLDAIATLAAERGLSFVVITDHNIHTAPDFFADVQARHPEVLLIPGVELTTYAGHGNGIGVTGWQDHRVGVDGATIQAAIDGYRAEGGLFAINHPVLDFECIGCAWTLPVDPQTIAGVEIQGTASPVVQAIFYDRAVAFWEDLLDRGGRAAALGGSDDHRAGVELNAVQSPVGDPTTLVLADELSVAGIVAGVRAGRTVVKLTGPDAPMLTLTSAVAPEEGSSMVRARRVELTFEASDLPPGEPLTLRVVRDGLTLEEVPVPSGEERFTHALIAAAGHRYRGELVGQERELVATSYLFLELPDDDGGRCGISASGSPRDGLGLLCLIVGAVGLRRRRRGLSRFPRDGRGTPAGGSPVVRGFQGVGGQLFRRKSRVRDRARSAASFT
jgi:hypothetical protein